MRFPVRRRSEIGQFVPVADVQFVKQRPFVRPGAENTPAIGIYILQPSNRLSKASPGRRDWSPDIYSVDIFMAVPTAATHGVWHSRQTLPRKTETSVADRVLEGRCRKLQRACL